jgi:hypothetical protein
MERVSFQDVCKNGCGAIYHISEKYTHVSNFVEGDYIVIYVSNGKETTCHFQNNTTKVFYDIKSNDAQYFDYYKK